MYMFKLIFIKLLIFNDKTLRIITKLKFDIKIYPACRCKNDLCTRDLTCWYLATRENFKTTAVCLFIPTCSHEITILGTLMMSILLHPNYQTCLEKKIDDKGPNGHTWEIWPWRLRKLWCSPYMFEIQHRPIFVRCYLVLVIIKALYTHMAITTPGFGPAIHCHFHLRPTVNRPDKASRNW